MKLALSFLLIAMGGAAACIADAQGVPLVNPCDLVQSPARFANQLVKVRATISIAFEDFTLETPGCGDVKDGHPIWLMYGGNEPTPILSTVNDMLRPAGRVMTVEGIPIPLTRNASLDEFRARLAAERTSFNGTACGDECRLYRVTATLTGIFFAGRTGGLPGFGHMGCCHLLAIERVSDVTARRTSVPAGGQFNCSQETWEIGVEEAISLKEEANNCDGFVDCRRKVFDEIAKVARQKGDEISESEDDHFYPYFGDLAWKSPDLLKAYSLKTKYRDSIHQTGPVEGISATRMICKPVSPPLPLDTPIGCRALHADFATTAKEVPAGPDYTQRALDSSQTGAADSAAQRALEDAAKQWGITPTRRLKFAGCGQITAYDGDKFSECQWLDPEGMEEFSLQVTKYGSLRHQRSWNTVPWILSRGSGLVCEVER